jgi:site-specific recombinase XerD
MFWAACCLAYFGFLHSSEFTVPNGAIFLQALHPLFVRFNGVMLTRTYLSERLRRLLSDAGIPGNFSSHSFRIGAATSAALAGVPDHLIQTLGQWSSSAYLTYIHSDTT